MVNKQPALGWQIAKQLSGLKPFSLNNNKNYSLKKKFFLCNKPKTVVKPIINQNLAVSKALLRKLYKHCS